jgi:hypothetical protein
MPQQMRVMYWWTDGSFRRTSYMRQQLDRLAKAVEKKTACEEAIQNLAAGLSEEGTDLTIMMDAVYVGRVEAVQAAAAAAASNFPNKKQ